MDLLLDIGMQFGADVLQSEITRMTFAFMIAAKLHARWVSKEFSLMRQSIDHLGATLGVRIDGIDQRVKKLESSGGDE